MTTYEVILSVAASATIVVEAESEADAIEAAHNEYLDDDVDIWGVDGVVLVEEISNAV